jgi:hypothetical protein
MNHSEMDANEEAKKYKIVVLDDYQNVRLRTPIGRCSAIAQRVMSLKVTL